MATRRLRLRRLCDVEIRVGVHDEAAAAHAQLAAAGRGGGERAGAGAVAHLLAHVAVVQATGDADYRYCEPAFECRTTKLIQL